MLATLHNSDLRSEPRGRQCAVNVLEGRYDPITLIVHVARPRFDFVDRGKTRLERLRMLPLYDDLRSAVRSVGKKWKALKRHADKLDRVSSQARQRLLRSAKTSIRNAAFEVMEAAYIKASGNDRFPANGRQIYYAARPAILQMTGASSLDSQYFTQTLLKDYLEEFSPGWDVVFDARGHLTEPHTERVVGLGGLNVREYIREFTNGDIPENPAFSPERTIPTVGPNFRYGAVLFIEKEGFDPLLRAARIAERFDVAIASTKGMPVSAFCDLLATLKRQGRRVYVVHDFDKWGFSIVGTLRRGTRGSQGTGEVVDLGLRLKDITGLEREPVRNNASPRKNLQDNGATSKEIGILDSGNGNGERVELNAMTSEQFIAWLERKLTEHGVRKVIPRGKTLEATYRRAVRCQRAAAEFERLRAEAGDRDIPIPDDLGERVRERLKTHPDQPWDDAVWNIAEDGD
jgi:DNA topoisomerase VI subunit A